MKHIARKIKSQRAAVQYVRSSVFKIINQAHNRLEPAGYLACNLEEGEAMIISRIHYAYNAPPPLAQTDSPSSYSLDSANLVVMNNYALASP